MMRKIRNLLAFTVLIVAVFSCEKPKPIDPVDPESSEKGDIQLEFKRDVFVKEDGEIHDNIPMNIDEYIVSVNDKEVSINSDGIITEISKGSRKISLTNYFDNFKASFNNAKYVGTVDVEVVADTIKKTPILLKHANAGLYFVFDKSLEDVFLSGVSALVKSESGNLKYENQTRDYIGYFAPGKLSVELMLNGETITVGGAESKDIELSAGDLWKITLKNSSNPETRAIDADIERVFFTDEDDWNLDAGSGVTNFNIPGLANKTVKIVYADGYTENVNFNASGELKLDLDVKQIITKFIDGKDTIYIGRRAGSTVSLKYDSGLKLADKIDSKVPISTVGELLLVERNIDLLDTDMTLEADLYFNGLEWKPIGKDYEDQFTGSLDGKNFKIYNLEINLPESTFPIGLFGVCEDAFIKDLSIESGNILGGRYTAAIAGRMSGDGYIENCVNRAKVHGNLNAVAGLVYNAWVDVRSCTNFGEISSDQGEVAGVAGNLRGVMEDCINHGTIKARSSIGGVVSSTTAPGSVVRDCINYGYLEGNNGIGGVANSIGYSEIINCTQEGIIKVLGPSGGIGGVAGGVGGSGAIMDGCVNNGEIILNDDPSVSHQTIGGVVGTSSQSAIIQNCINNSDLIYDNVRNLGGIIGTINGSTVTKCENKGKVINGGDVTGGVIGNHISGIGSFLVNSAEVEGSDFTGGLVGFSDESSKLRMSVNNAKVTGASFTGGVSGATWGTISACKNNAEVVGEQYTGGVAGAAAGKYSFVVASYNVGEVSGTSEVGGVTGIVRDVAIVQSCYSVANVNGDDKVGGVCGSYYDTYSSLIDCYWSGYQGQGVGDQVGYPVYYFTDGTNAPVGSEGGWPEAENEHWGINPEGEQGVNALWWKTLGTPGSTSYPLLWWEE